MKIILLHWPINNIGGILTWIREIRHGLEALGHEVRTVCPIDVRPRNKEISEDDYYKGVPACRYAPIVTDGELEATMAELNAADLVIITHPSPHPTKAQLARVDEGKRWQKVYKRLRVPRVVVFHDNMWHRTNSWFAEVSKHAPVTVAAQSLFMESLEKYPSLHKEWVYHPMRIPDVDQWAPVEERVGGMMATQWLGWKRHRRFIEDVVPHIRGEMDFDLYNVGIEYYYLRKEEAFQNHVYDAVVNSPDLPEADAHTVWFRGAVPHEEILRQLMRRSISVDYSKRGYANYTHWEPLCCGAFSFVHEDVLANPRCKLPDPKRYPTVVPFNDDNIRQLLFEKSRETMQPDRLAMREWCVERMQPKVICKRLIEVAAQPERKRL